MPIDDTLILGYTKNGTLQGADRVALSVSTAKLYLEDPMRFYLKKVRHLKEPMSLPLVYGSAGHGALEAYYAHGGTLDERVNASMQAFQKTVAEMFGKVPDPTVNVNPKDASNPRGKVERPVGQEEFVATGLADVEQWVRMLAGGWDRYSPLQLQMDPLSKVEQVLGEVAKRNGYPTVDMSVFDVRTMRYRTLPVALIAGVPFHGYIDLIMDWIDGTQAIVDHKFVSQIVKYYPVGRSRRGYPPSYNPADSFQLDLYSYATGIERAGFQYFSRYPQYIPDTGTLWEGWVDEPTWHASSTITTELPMAWALTPSDRQLRYAMTWRPTPDDHPSRPQAYTRQAIMPRTVSTVRKAAEGITESFLLWKSGVEPEIAFPAGNPEDIARKMCPYCIWQGAECSTPRSVGDDEIYRRTIQRREVLCQQNPQIMERRQQWTHSVSLSLT